MSGFNQPDKPTEPPADQSAASHQPTHASDADHVSDVARETLGAERLPEISDERLQNMSQDELVDVGSKLDGVEVVSREYRLAPGSRAEKGAERRVTMCFSLAAVLVLAFLVLYIWWPWKFTDTKPGESTLASYYTPLLGFTLGGALLLIGAGLVLWSRDLMPHEVSIQARHEGASPEIERLATAATLQQGADSIGIGRRTMIRRSLMGAGGLFGLVLVVPIVGGMIKNPYKDNGLYYTSWRKNMRLVRLNGTPIRPSDMEPGSLESVFPGLKGSMTPNIIADSATMLIRMHQDQADKFQARPGQEDFRWNEYVAYTKICSHLGCPVSLYEQQTGRILCPCHQSQFDVTRDAKPIFGPATRSLASLPIELDDDGYFIARSDYKEAVGPAFWDRERRP